MPESQLADRTPLAVMEWSRSVQPVYDCFYGPQTSANDAVALAKELCRIKGELLSHDAKYCEFYESYVCLVAHYIASKLTNAATLTDWDAKWATDGLRVVIDYLTTKWSPQSPHTTLNARAVAHTLLCCIDLPHSLVLPRTDVLHLFANLKRPTYRPMHIRMAPKEEKAAGVAKVDKRTKSKEGDANVLGRLHMKDIFRHDSDGRSNGTAQLRTNIEQSLIAYAREEGIVVKLLPSLESTLTNWRECGDVSKVATEPLTNVVINDLADITGVLSKLLLTTLFNTSNVQMTHKLVALTKRSINVVIFVSIDRYNVPTAETENGEEQQQPAVKLATQNTVDHAAVQMVEQLTTVVVPRLCSLVKSSMCDPNTIISHLCSICRHLTTACRRLADATNDLSTNEHAPPTVIQCALVNAVSDVAQVCMESADEVIKNTEEEHPRAINELVSTTLRPWVLLQLSMVTRCAQQCFMPILRQEDDRDDDTPTASPSKVVKPSKLEHKICSLPQIAAPITHRTTTSSSDALIGEWMTDIMSEVTSMAAAVKERTTTTHSMSFYSATGAEFDNYSRLTLHPSWPTKVQRQPGRMTFEAANLWSGFAAHSMHNLHSLVDGKHADVVQKQTVKMLMDIECMTAVLQLVKMADDLVMNVDPSVSRVWHKVLSFMVKLFGLSDHLLAEHLPVYLIKIIGISTDNPTYTLTNTHFPMQLQPHANFAVGHCLMAMINNAPSIGITGDEYGQVVDVWRRYIIAHMRAALKPSSSLSSLYATNMCDMMMTVFYALPIHERKIILVEFTREIVQVMDKCDSFPTATHMTAAVYLISYMLRNMIEAPANFREYVKINILPDVEDTDFSIPSILFLLNLTGDDHRNMAVGDYHKTSGSCIFCAPLKSTPPRVTYDCDSIARKTICKSGEVYQQFHKALCRLAFGVANFDTNCGADSLRVQSVAWNTLSCLPIPLYYAEQLIELREKKQMPEPVTVALLLASNIHWDHNRTTQVDMLGRQIGNRENAVNIIDGIHKSLNWQVFILDSIDLYTRGVHDTNAADSKSTHDSAAEETNWNSVMEYVHVLIYLRFCVDITTETWPEECVQKLAAILERAMAHFMDTAADIVLEGEKEMYAQLIACLSPESDKTFNDSTISNLYANIASIPQLSMSPLLKHGYTTAQLHSQMHNYAVYNAGNVYSKEGDKEDDDGFHTNGCVVMTAMALGLHMVGDVLLRQAENCNIDMNFGVEGGMIAKLHMHACTPKSTKNMLIEGDLTLDPARRLRAQYQLFRVAAQSKPSVSLVLIEQMHGQSMDPSLWPCLRDMFDGDERDDFPTAVLSVMSSKEWLRWICDICGLCIVANDMQPRVLLKNNHPPITLMNCHMASEINHDVFDQDEEQGIKEFCMHFIEEGYVPATLVQQWIVNGAASITNDGGKDAARGGDVLALLNSLCVVLNSYAQNGEASYAATILTLLVKSYTTSMPNLHNSDAASIADWLTTTPANEQSRRETIALLAFDYAILIVETGDLQQISAVTTYVHESVAHIQRLIAALKTDNKSIATIRELIVCARTLTTFNRYVNRCAQEGADSAVFMNDDRTEVDTGSGVAIIDVTTATDNCHTSCDNVKVDHRALCTYVQTGNKFTDQHWYHCHSCAMVVTEGVCTVCAQVCHAGHDLTYSKCGSFFCDCGAQPHTCNALTARAAGAEAEEEPPRVTVLRTPDVATVTQQTQHRSPSNVFVSPTMAEAIRHSFPTSIMADIQGRISTILQSFLPQPKPLSSLTSLESAYQSLGGVGTPTLDMPNFRQYAWESKASQVSITNRSGSSSKSATDKGGVWAGSRHGAYMDSSVMVTVEVDDRIFVVCTHDQKRAVALVDPVKLTDRVASTGASTVQHECIVEVRRVGEPLLNIYSSFDVVALCSLTDCTIMSVTMDDRRTPTMTVVGALHPTAHMPANAQIIKCVFSSVTRGLLALVLTNNTVFVYDTLKSMSSPRYVFTLASQCKIRDVAFAWFDMASSEEKREVLILAGEDGEVYAQPLDDGCAVQGCSIADSAFLVSNMLLGVGISGVSVVALHFVHSLRLICVSFVNGVNKLWHVMPTFNDSWICVGDPCVLPPITREMCGLKNSPNGNSSKAILGVVGQQQKPPVALMKWSTSRKYPGVIFALAHHSGHWSTSSTVAHPQDAALIAIYVSPSRTVHCGPVEHYNDPNSTVSLVDYTIIDGAQHRVTGATALCANGAGALSLVVVNADCAPNGWLREADYVSMTGEEGSHVEMVSVQKVLLPAETPRRPSTSSNPAVDIITISVDRVYDENRPPVGFFDRCSLVGAEGMEMGGTLIGRYDAQMLKTRLMNMSKGIAWTIREGCTIQVRLRNQENLIAGVQVKLGKHSAGAQPRYMTIGGVKHIFPTLGTERIFDVQLTNKQSAVTANGQPLSIIFGPSNDENAPNTIVEGLKVYARSAQFSAMLPRMTKKQLRNATEAVVVEAPVAFHSNDSNVPLWRDVATASLLNFVNDHQHGVEQEETKVDLGCAIMKVALDSSASRIARTAADTYLTDREETKIRMSAHWLLAELRDQSDAQFGADRLMQLLTVLRQLTKEDTMSTFHSAVDGKIVDLLTSVNTALCLVISQGDRLSRRVTVLQRVCTVDQVNAFVYAWAQILFNCCRHMIGSKSTTDQLPAVLELVTNSLLLQDVPTASAMCTQLVQCLTLEVERGQPKGATKQTEVTVAAPLANAEFPLLSPLHEPQVVAETDFNEEELEEGEEEDPLLPDEETLMDGLAADDVVEMAVEGGDEEQVNIFGHLIDVDTQDEGEEEEDDDEEEEEDMEAHQLELAIQMSLHESELATDGTAADDNLDTVSTAANVATSNAGDDAHDSVESARNSTPNSSGDEAPSTQGVTESSEMAPPIVVEQPIASTASADGDIMTTLRGALLEHMMTKFDEVANWADEAGLRQVAFMRMLVHLTTSVGAHQMPLLERTAGRLASFVTEKLAVDDDTSYNSPMMLLTLRVLGVLLASARPTEGNAASGKQVSAASQQLSRVGVSVAKLCNSTEMIAVCYKLLFDSKSFNTSEALTSTTTGSTSATILSSGPPSVELMPFFCAYGECPFKHCRALLMEMALRLPYIIAKAVECDREVVGEFVLNGETNADWPHMLSELISSDVQSVTIKKQARKLMPRIVGGKINYRLYRDQYAAANTLQRLTAHLSSTSAENLSRSTLLSVLSDLQSLKDVAHKRHANWLHIVRELTNEREGGDVCSTLIRWSTHTHVDSVVDKALQILQISLAPDGNVQAGLCADAEWSQKIPNSIALLHGDMVTKSRIVFDTVIPQILEKEDLLIKCLTMHLIQSHVPIRRQLTLNVVKAIFDSCTPSTHSQLFATLLSLWPTWSKYGCRGVAYMEAVIHAADKSGTEEEVAALRTRCRRELARNVDGIKKHQNHEMYERLSRLETLTGYHLEREPCLVCYANPDSFKMYALNDIGTDPKSSTSAQYIKLNDRYEVKNITVRLTHQAKEKMIHHIQVHYTAKMITTQTLKSSEDCWMFAAAGEMAPGQQYIEIDMKIPVVATGLKIAYVDFYEQPTSQLLRCARCPHMPPTMANQCSSCSESLLQCDKCRNINYDERQPFMCKMCGYSKFVKLDIHVAARKTHVLQVEGDVDKLEDTTLTTKADSCRAKLARHVTAVEAMFTAQSMGVPDTNATQTSCKIFPSKQMYTEDCAKATTQLASTQRALAAKAYSADHTGEQHPYQMASNPTCYACAISRTQQLLTCLTQVPMSEEENDDDEGLLAVRLLKTILDDDLPPGLLNDAALLIAKVGNRQTRVTHLNGEALCSVVAGRDRLRVCSNLLRLITNGGDNVIRALILAIRQRRDAIAVGILTAVGHLFEKHSPFDSVAMFDLFMPVLGMPLVVDQEDNKEGNPNPILRTYFDKWVAAANNDATGPTVDGDHWTIGEYILLGTHCSQVRRAAVNTISVTMQCVAQYQKEMALYLPRMLHNVLTVGIRSVEYISLLSAMIRWSAGIRHLYHDRRLPSRIATLITKLVERQLNTTDSAFALDSLSTLLSELLNVSEERIATVKCHLLQPVLRASLALCTLNSQTTHMARGAQIVLLNILTQITHATHTDAKHFMAVCVSTLAEREWSDDRAPAFVFDRLASTIHTTDDQPGIFLVQIDKAAIQEEFLPNRMNSNPYSSDVMGVTMRDVKRKICIDTEMSSFVDDDNALDLVIDNQCISLDLPLADVYRVLWAPKFPGRPMQITYRVRGLQESTEPFVDTLTKGDGAEENSEEGYMLAREMLACDGLTAVLKALSSITGQSAITSGIRLLSMCVRNSANRAALLANDALAIVLDKLLLVIDAAPTTGDAVWPIVEEMLAVAHTLVGHAITQFTDAEFEKWASTSATTSHVQRLCGAIDTHDSVGKIREKLISLVTNVTLGSVERMDALIEVYREAVKFDRYDMLVTQRSTNGTTSSTNVISPVYVRHQLDTFCAVAQAIHSSARGGALKDRMLAQEILSDAIVYLSVHQPSGNSVTLTVDSPELKEFLERPALKYVLRVLTGMCTKHAASQEMVAADSIPLIHRLEGISTEQWSGSLAEQLMDALKDNEAVAQKIEQVRKETKRKKREQAMLMRQKQLAMMNMKANALGQVRVLKDAAKISGGSDSLDDDAEEILSCSICRDGYRHQPNKVLCAYVFAKRAPIDERATGFTYNSVTQFILVHFDCHQNAIKVARGRDEWQSAVLHNAGTQCNALMPLYGAQVAPHTYALCFARYVNDVQQVANVVGVSSSSALHDLRMLLRRYVEHVSFSTDTGGGGTESNINLIATFLQLATYMSIEHSTQVGEQAKLMAYVTCTETACRAATMTAENAEYFLMTSLIYMSTDVWKEQKGNLLKRVIASEVHKCNRASIQLDADRSQLRNILAIFDFVQSIRRHIIEEICDKSIAADSESADITYGHKLLTAMRKNDSAVYKTCQTKIMVDFNDRIDKITTVAGFEESIDLNEWDKSWNEYITEAIEWINKK